MQRLIPFVLLLAACPKDDGDDTLVETDDTEVADVACTPVPPAELLRKAGLQDDGVTFLALDGRSATPPGPNLVLPGYPSHVVVHPTLPVAYVASTSVDDRLLLVIDLDRQEVLQTVDRGNALHGLALSADGGRLYAAGGGNDDVDVYDVGEDGTVTVVTSIDVGGYAASVALAPEGDRLWVGLFVDDEVVEIDVEELAVRRRLSLPIGGWDLAYLPSRRELYVADLQDDQIGVVDVDGWRLSSAIDVPLSAVGLAVAPDDGTVWVASAGGDEVIALDTSTATIAGRARVTDDWLDHAGEPLGSSNVNSVAVDPAGERLYVTRGADNAVSVFDAATLDLLGAIPAPQHPTWSAITPDGGTLVVAAGKGGGAGPSNGQSPSKRIAGSVATVDLGTIDLAATTVEVARQFARSAELFDFDCAGRFPIPTPSGTGTPIEHVVLVVKENKTFDCVFGDFEGAERDPSLVRWGEDVTPNLHALARRFVLTDNFYDQVQESDNGHLFLTQASITEFDERAFMEQSAAGKLTAFTVADPAVPPVGNLFTRLMDAGVDFQVYGEIVGMFTKAADGATPIEHSDALYPGGPFFNTGPLDVDKAQYIVDRIGEGRMPPFTFLLLPNDHTSGTAPGIPTPESMIADNDAGVGLLVDAISHSPYWEKTVIFVVEDDPQAGEDHVDAHRSYALVISPWTQRGYVSKVHSSFLSVHASIERILGVPPLARPDATVAPMWDVFTQTPDLEPYTAIPRSWPVEVNPPRAVGAEASARMDFRGPDRNPGLGPLLEAYRLERMGRISRAEAERRVLHPDVDPELWAERVEEAEEEEDAFERDMARYRAWVAGRP